MNQLVFQNEKFNKNNNLIKSSNLDIKSHIQNVLKAKKGQKLNISIINEGIGLGEIIEFTDEITIKVTDLNPPKSPWFDLVVGISRPQTCKKVIEHAITMGAKSITFTPTKLSEKSYKDSKIWQPKQLNKLIFLGLSQSRQYAHWPKIEVLKHRDQLPTTSKNSFFFSLESNEWLKTNDVNKFFTFAIGPERGWTKEEESFLKLKGFRAKTLSTSVLRVENATIAAIAQAELILARL